MKNFAKQQQQQQQHVNGLARLFSNSYNILETYPLHLKVH